MKTSQRYGLLLSVAALSGMMACPGYAAFLDTFESGSTSGWMYATSGGYGSTGVQMHNSSQMAYVSHTGGGNPYSSTTTSSSLKRDFVYLASDLLSFDMHALANTASGNPSGTKHSGSGVKVTFLNAFNVALGSAGLYNYTYPAMLGVHEYLIDNTQHNYRASMADFATLAGLDPQGPIAKIGLTFTAWGQFSGGGNIYPNVGATANVWFDNVAVGPVPEPESYALMLSGLAVMLFFTQRRRIH